MCTCVACVGLCSVHVYGDTEIFFKPVVLSTAVVLSLPPLIAVVVQMNIVLAGGTSTYMHAGVYLHATAILAACPYNQDAPFHKETGEEDAHSLLNKIKSEEKKERGRISSRHSSQCSVLAGSSLSLPPPLSLSHFMRSKFQLAFAIVLAGFFLFPLIFLC